MFFLIAYRAESNLQLDMNFLTTSALLIVEPRASSPQKGDTRGRMLVARAGNFGPSASAPSILTGEDINKKRRCQQRQAAGLAPKRRDPRKNAGGSGWGNFAASSTRSLIHGETSCGVIPRQHLSPAGCEDSNF